MQKKTNEWMQKQEKKYELLEKKNKLMRARKKKEEKIREIDKKDKDSNAKKRIMKVMQSIDNEVEGINNKICEMCGHTFNIEPSFLQLASNQPIIRRCEVCGYEEVAQFTRKLKAKH